MKKLLIIISIISTILTSNAQAVYLETEADSMSYAMGLDFGNYLKNLDNTINVDILSQSIKDVLDDSAIMSQEEAYDFLREYFMVRIPARKLAESEKYLENVVKENSKAGKTASDLLYEIVDEGGDIRAIDDEDVVVVDYIGYLPDGTVFDSSEVHGEHAEFQLSHVIKGWTEGLKLIGKGGKIKLWVHPDLAYGQNGAGGVISPNEALHFEIDLIDVKPHTENYERKTVDISNP